MAYRKFEYFPSRVSEIHQDTPLQVEWVGTTFFKHAFCGSGQFVSRETLESNWISGKPQGPTGVQIKSLEKAESGTSFRETLTRIIAKASASDWGI